MRKIFEAFLFCLLMAGPVAPAAAKENTVRIVVYGDSLTAGHRLQPEEAFPARLERKLKEVGFTNLEVINMSEYGATTATGVEKLEALLRLRPDVVLLALGSNDVQRGIQVNLIERNINQIIPKLQDSGAYIVLAGAKGPQHMGLAYSQQVDAMFRARAGYYRVQFYAHLLEGVSGKPGLTLADGLHPNPKGVEVMVSHLYPLIDPGVRWKIQTMQYQQEYERYQQQQQMSH